VLPAAAAAGPAAAAWFCDGLLQLQQHTPQHLWWDYCRLLLLQVLLLLRVVWLTGFHPCQSHPMLLLLLLVLPT
jgi:hypothetical protein